jgi:hypothetical protein
MLVVPWLPGVYRATAACIANEPNHAMVIVGYDVTNPTNPYW